jgi:hypothetical protein
VQSGPTSGRVLLLALVTAALAGVGSAVSMANMSGRVLIDAVERQACRFERIVATEQQGPWTFYDVACKGMSRIVRVACTPDSCTTVSRPSEEYPVDEGQP